jgi:HSP20 family protein
MTLSVQAHEEEKLSSVARQMSKWVDQVFGKNFHCSSETWTPSINLYETEAFYLLVMELAGIDPEKIDLRVERRLLIIFGHRDTPELPEGDRAVNLLMMEIDHGSFCRSLKLPPDVDDIDAISASYRGGYLWIRLPKKI